MNMELGVDSKPKEHPTPEFADNWRFPPLVAATASWVAVDDKLCQKLLADHRKAIRAKDLQHGDTMLRWRDRCARRMRWMLPAAVQLVPRIDPWRTFAGSQPTTVVYVEMGATKSGS
jgi:hypothetical protein